MRGILKPFRRFWAWLGGYFWHDCPICGESFGGFEVGGAVDYTYGKIVTPDGRSVGAWFKGECVCKNCVDEANRMNELFLKTHNIL